MQNSHSTLRQKSGGRVSSSELRESLKGRDEGQGLHSKVDRYHLLKLVERVGKGAGFTPRMVDLLAYYLRFTRDDDWEQGSRPMVYQSLSRTALDFGVSERQIQKLENALFEVGALSWQDSGNHRRFGQRCPKSGKILYAYGVDLSPLAELQDGLEELLEKKETHARQWMETKRQISFYRRQVKACLAEAREQMSIEPDQIKLLEDRYEEVAVQIRTHISLPRLHELLLKHRELFQQTKVLLEQGRAAVECEKTENDTPRNEEKFAHNNNTNHIPSNKFDTGRAAPNRLARGRKGRVCTPNETSSSEESLSGQRRVGGFHSASYPDQNSQTSGTGQINLKQIINASSSRFQEYMPFDTRSVNEYHLVEAADSLRGTLQISMGSWSRACHEMGRVGAAICLMLTDQASLREANPARIPGAYFNGMINRSKRGELNLRPAIHALLKRTHDGQSPTPVLS